MQKENPKGSSWLCLVVKIWYNHTMGNKNKKGFTLVEMLIVIAIIGIIAAATITTSRTFREQVVFSSNYQNVESLIAEARNRSLTGESFIDTNDFDNDDSFDDLILPNGYIVNFKTEDGVTTASLYADLFQPVIGELDVDDMLLKSVELDDSIKIEVSSERKTGNPAVINSDDFSIIYTTPSAEFDLIGEPDTSLEIKIYQVDGEDDEIRSMHIFMHYLFGIPEVLNDSYLELEEEASIPASIPGPVFPTFPTGPIIPGPGPTGPTLPITPTIPGPTLPGPGPQTPGFTLPGPTTPGPTIPGPIGPTIPAFSTI